MRAHLARAAQINDQLAPGPAARRRGIGAAPLPASITDLTSLVASEPSAATAWGQVQTSLTAEGNGPSSAVAGVAGTHFYNAWTQLASTVPAFSSSDLGNISNAAMNLSLQNNSIGAAGSLVDGLVQGATSGNPVEIVQAFSGSMCSLLAGAVAAGAVSFGAGAAIMVGIALITTWLDGLFQSPPTVATVCGWNLTYQPEIVLNCAWTQGGQGPVQVGYGQLGVAGQPPQSNPFWRRLPEPSNSADAWWFAPNNDPIGLSQTSWTSGRSTDPWNAATQNGLRPIDAAYPQYHQLECDTSAAAMVAVLPDSGGPYPAVVNGQPTLQTASADDVMFARFILAYFGAWKANAEYSLNGIAPQYADDAAVLMHLYQFWQNTHQPGATRTITPRNNIVPLSSQPVIAYPNACAGTLQNEWWYVSMLLNKAGVSSLVVNTGPKIVFSSAMTAGAAAVGTKNASSTTSKVLIGTAVAAAAALLATALYARRKHTTTKAVLRSAAKKTWSKTGGKIHLPHHLLGRRR